MPVPWLWLACVSRIARNSRIPSSDGVFTDPAGTDEQGQDTADRWGTDFFLLCNLPEALPIAVITRFIHWFEEFGIPFGWVVVNMLIDKDCVGPETPDLVRNRIAMQSEYMEQIEKLFDGSVRAILPLFETEVRGVEMLDRTAKLLFQ
jgi:anion-transporting  ArsA/GET3 family ATPase